MKQYIRHHRVRTTGLMLGAIILVAGTSWLFLVRGSASQELLRWILAALSLLLITLVAMASSSRMVRQTASAHTPPGNALRVRTRDWHGPIIFESIGDGVIATDASGRIELINPTAEQLTGWTRTSAIGTPLEHVFRIADGKTGEMVTGLAERIFREERVTGSCDDPLLVTKQGLQCPISDSGTLIRSEDGAPLGIVLIFRDRTTERNANLSLRQKAERDAALADIGAQLLEHSGPIEPIAECVLQHALSLSDSTDGWIMAIDRETGDATVLASARTCTCAISTNDHGPSKILRRQAAGRYPGLWGHALNLRQPFATNKPSRHPACRDSSDDIPYRSFLAVPVIAGGELLGQIALANAKTGYAGEQLGSIGRLADLYGLFLRQWVLRYELRENESRFRHISSCSSDLAYSCSSGLETDPSIDWLSGAAERITGYAPEEILTLGCWSKLLIEDDRSRFERHVLRLPPGENSCCELRIRHKSGQLVWVRSFAKCVRQEHTPGQLQIYGALLDITDRHEAEVKNRLYAAVINSTRDGVLITDLSANVVAVNRAYTEITGYGEEEVIGRNPRLQQSGRHDPAFYQTLWSTLRQAGHWQGEIWNRRKNGEIYPEWQTISTIHDTDGRATHYVAVFTDISQRKESESRLERLAHYDPLTDLPNRLLVKSRLEHALDRARRRNGLVAVLFIDLDRFKTVNDSLGHPAGDALLAGVAKRLAARLRKEDTLGRLGGDEFLVIVEDLAHSDDATIVAQNLLQALEHPFQLPEGPEIYIRASIGISLFPNDGINSAELIRNADAAMYQVKDSGRNAHGYYTHELTQAAAERLEMETRLRRALERDEFVLHYQPIVSVSDDRLIGAEALVRWHPAGEDLVLPGGFIGLAEETGLIVPLGEWVLGQTCRQAKAWLDAGFSFGQMALNLSVRQFHQRNLETLVASILHETNLPPACLELEITEGCLLKRGADTERSLRAIKSMGVQLSIDDFGTGYSSLAHLKSLPLDRLKIDCRFIRDISGDRNEKAIASTVIAMAHHLGLRAIAEGVETAAQLDFLRQQGCDAYQGFLFCPPLPADEFAARYLYRCH